MADKTDKLSPLEQLEKQHARDTADRQAKIAAATRDLRDAEAMVRELKAKIGGLQQENITASFAFDARRAELSPAKSKAA